MQSLQCANLENYSVMRSASSFGNGCIKTKLACGTLHSTERNTSKDPTNLTCRKKHFHQHSLHTTTRIIPCYSLYSSKHSLVNHRNKNAFFFIVSNISHRSYFLTQSTQIATIDNFLHIMSIKSDSLGTKKKLGKNYRRKSTREYT